MSPTAPAAPEPKASEPGPPQGVRVVKATSTNIANRTKSKSRGAAKREPVAPPADPPPPPPPNQERYKESGRRGGVKYYKRRVRRG